VKVYLLPQAEAELGGIADPLFSMVVHKLELLGSFPLLGPALEGPLSGYRTLTVGLFRVIYRIVREERIEVAYIRHCKRKPILK